MLVDSMLDRTFGRLTVVNREPNKSGHIYYRCRCVCGKEVVVRKQNLVKGVAKSCGCFRIEKTIERSIAHNTFMKMGKVTKMFDNNGNECLIDTEDVKRVSSQYWSKQWRDYWISQRHKTQTRLHRFIMGCSEDFEVDHIDGNTSNNTKANLRKCSHRENSRNIKVSKNSTTGVTGVAFVKRTNKYMARIKFESKSIFLGYFDSLEEASRVRQEAEVKYFGEYRRKHK